MDTELFEPLIDENAVAELLYESPRTVQGRRQRGDGPSYYKIGRSVKYKLSEVRAFIDERRVSSTANYSENRQDTA